MESNLCVGWMSLRLLTQQKQKFTTQDWLFMYLFFLEVWLIDVEETCFKNGILTFMRGHVPSKSSCCSFYVHRNVNSFAMSMKLNYLELPSLCSCWQHIFSKHLPALVWYSVWHMKKTQEGKGSLSFLIKLMYILTGCNCCLF